MSLDDCFCWLPCGMGASWAAGGEGGDGDEAGIRALGVALGAESFRILQRLTPGGSLQLVQLRCQQELPESCWSRPSVGSLDS